MPDDLYHRDILAWSKAQAERLRRVAAGERVNDVDWAHVIEEIEDVGNSILKSARSHFRNALIHALKVVAWPGHRDVEHWAQEVAIFLGNARDRYEPGMAQHIDPAALYTRALKEVRRLPIAGPAPLPLPEAVPLSVAELADEDFGAADLLDRIRAALPPTPAA